MTLEKQWSIYMNKSKAAHKEGDEKNAVNLACYAIESIELELQSCTDPDQKKFLQDMWDANEKRIDRILVNYEPTLNEEGEVIENAGTLSVTHDSDSSTSRTDPRFENKYKPTRDIPKLTFDDVIGMEELKTDLRMGVIYPLTRKDKMKGFNTLGQNMGVVLYGPPGCGKTYFAQAAAGETARQVEQETYYAAVSGANIKSMWEGKSLQNLRTVFEEAATAADKDCPAYLFFDELTGLGHKRNEVNENSNELLEEFKSDFALIEGKRVFVIGATNYPWDLDSILTRQERFGAKIYVPPPDEEAREGIFQLLADGAEIAEDVDFQLLAEITEFYAGSDIKAIYKAAERYAFQDRIENDNERPVTMEDFLKAKEKITSSLGPWASEIISNSDKVVGTPYAAILENAMEIIETLRERGEYYE